MCKWEAIFSSCCKYSTKAMREDGGFEVIKKAILNLSLRHDLHISEYGEGNERRLTGLHETASISDFSWVRFEEPFFIFSHVLLPVYLQGILIITLHLSGCSKSWLLYSGGARHWGKRERYVLSLRSRNYLHCLGMWKQIVPTKKLEDILQA
jgi:hypothetical protein